MRTDFRAFTYGHLPAEPHRNIRTPARRYVWLFLRHTCTACVRARYGVTEPRPLAYSRRSQTHVADGENGYASSSRTVTPPRLKGA